MAEEKRSNLFMIGLISTSDEKRRVLDRIFFLPKKLARILEMLKSFEQSKIFLTKVSKKEAPNYYKVIKSPMDLGIVQKKIRKYRSFDEFKADLDLIWNNCLEFNEGRYYRDCAIKMREVVSTLEIEMIAISRDKEFPMASEVIEGGDSYGLAAKFAIWRIVGKALVSVGYSLASKAALETLSGVLQHEILEIIKNKICGAEEV